VATPAPDIAAAFDRAMARDDLYFFTRYGFLQQRGTKWLRNWHHAKICAALERVYRGECKRLIINIPPRYSKTEIAVVNFIAWSLGKCPDAEFIHASYSARLATQNSWRTKGLVQTAWYNAIFPDVALCDDSKAKDEWRTTAGGVMYATGAGGTITGYGAGKMREGFGGCFPHAEMVATERGPVAIGDLVANVAPTRVWSYNETTRITELRSISRFWKNPANHIIELSSRDGRTMRCTPDHEIFTRAGWVSAVHIAKALDLVNGQFGLPRSLDASEPAIKRDLYDSFRMLWLCVPYSIRQAMRDADPSLAQLDLPDHPNADAISGAELGRAFVTVENGQHIIADEFGTGPALQYRKGSVSQRILHVVGLAAIREIGKRIVQGVAIEVPDLCRQGSWAYKLLSDEVSNVAQRDATSDRKVDASISVPIVRRLQRAQGQCPADLSKVRHLVQPFGAADWTPDTVRYVGHEDETFCLEVEGNHNFVLAQSGAIVSNCIIIDDPHKADEARSDVMRQNVIDWFQTTMESRTNSPDTPIIVIMQRLHERDLAGWLIDGGNGEEWESLVLPALTDDDTTALWPAKHDVAALLRMQEASPYTFAGQYGQRPAPLAGGIIKPDRIEVIEALPAGMQWVRAWDFGATEGGGDPTVGAKLGLTKEGRVIIADITRGQWGPEGVEAAMKNTAGRDGTSCRIRIPQDPGQAGKAQVASMVRLLSGYSVAAAPVSGDKITRAEPLAAQINVGNVSMLRADWNDALVSEMRMFPNGAHDDQVDACADAYAALHTGNTGLLDYYAALVAKQKAEKEATQHG
jgi:predicted phage terminase large subunit-like protein